MKMAQSAMLEARAAGNKHFERGAKLKAQIQREAKEDKARERKALRKKTFKESPQALQGIVPEATLQETSDSARSLPRKRSVHFRERSETEGSLPDVEVAHPCCPDYSTQLV